MNSNRMFKALFAALVMMMLAVTSMSVIATPSAQEETAAEAETLRIEVAEDTNRFVFDEAPIFDDGMPAYGNSFVTMGYIYPEGTLDGTNGVLENGDPEFPDMVIGEWICRGFFIGDGAYTEEGAWVITTQTYNFSDKQGDEMLITEGYELAEPGVTGLRAVTGGTGQYAGARGQAEQVFLGFNATEGVVLSFKITVE